jgi:hypothetical protein
LAPDLDEDGDLLLTALADAGMQPEVKLWDDPGAHWAGFDLVLVRSTWDYPLRRNAFLAWARRCRRTANPQHVLEWNTDKHYLHDLAGAGVPTVPTVFVPPDQQPQWPAGDFVVKPAVSGSAADTGRFSGDDPGAHDLVRRLHQQARTAMVQPYVPGIDVEGETSLVYLGGAYSHAVRRVPLLTAAGERAPVVVADVLGTVLPVEASAAQRRVAGLALDAVPDVPEGLPTPGWTSCQARTDPWCSSSRRPTAFSFCPSPALTPSAE